MKKHKCPTVELSESEHLKKHASYVLIWLVLVYLNRIRNMNKIALPLFFDLVKLGFYNVGAAGRKAC